MNEPTLSLVSNNFLDRIESSCFPSFCPSHPPHLRQSVMKVSIISAVYNAAPVIQQCIESVLSQDYPFIEYIVVDGGSTDGTVDVLHAYEHRITRWISEPDKGLYDALNKGIRMATGDIIGILHADDLFASTDVISAVVRVMQEKGVDSLYGNLHYVARNNLDRTLRDWQSCDFKRRDFQYGWMPAHPTFYVRRRIFEEYGLYRLNYGTAADYELMLRFLYKNRVSTCFMNKLMVKMRVGGSSNRSIWSHLKANLFDLKAMWDHRVFFPPLSAVLKPIRKANQFIWYRQLKSSLHQFILSLYHILG